MDSFLLPVVYSRRPEMAKHKAQPGDVRPRATRGSHPVSPKGGRSFYSIFFFSCLYRFFLKS